MRTFEELRKLASIDKLTLINTRTYVKRQKQTHLIEKLTLINTRTYINKHANLH